MVKSNKIFKSYALCVAEKTNNIVERAIAFLYFRAIMTAKPGVSIHKIISDFEIAGLGKPNLTRLRNSIAKDRRTSKVDTDKWRLRADKFNTIENKFSECFNIKSNKFPNKNYCKDEYISFSRIKELKEIKTSRFDSTRLVKMCEELNDNFSQENYISVITLVRAVIDHVPPIFGYKNYKEVANNYKCAKSTKKSFQNLENSSRNIADAYLHILIRDKEILPTDKQVNFSNDLDTLLSEVIRILKPLRKT